MRLCISLMSAPAAKAFSLPVMTIAPIAASASADYACLAGMSWTLDEALANPPAARLVSLRFGEVKRFEAHIAELSHLRELEIIAIGLRKVPDAFRALESLVRIDLSDNVLTALPEWIGELSSLTELTAASNRITRIPDGIYELRALENLDLADNAIETVSDRIGELAELRRLAFSGNRLTQLPAAVGRLAHLEYLYLNQNLLTELPPEIGDLQKLSELQLAYNRLTELPSKLSRLLALEWLTLRDNPLLPGQRERIKAALPSCTITG